MIISFITSLLFSTIILHNIKICKSLNYYPYNESLTLDKLNEHIDWEVDPCNDFYEFVCGTHFKNNNNSEIRYSPKPIKFDIPDLKNYYNGLKRLVDLKGLEKILNILDFFLNANYVISKNERFYLYMLISYSSQHIVLNYLPEHPDVKYGLKFVKKIFKDMKEEAFLLINEKDWLDRETKEMLLEKLAFLNFDFTINKGIANKKYYEYCINAIPFDSSKLPQEAMENIKNYINVYSHRLKFDEISCYELIGFALRATDPNGVYYTKMNLLDISLSLLIDPYFNIEFPISLNYGILAELIGHEILHAFDTNNRLIDQYGNSKKITTEKSDKELKTREQCLIDQYSSQTIEGINKKVNGTATLDENLGDNGSIKLAYRTYLKYVKRLNYKMKPLKGKKKLSSNQLFFISGARFYCYKRSKESLIEQQEKDEHTTEKNRLMTSLSNFNPFAKAFNCKIGTPMNPKNKCEVWRHK